MNCRRGLRVWALGAGILVLLTSLCGVASVNAQTEESNFVTSWSKFVDDGSMPGAVLIVATPTEILSVDALGWADIDSKTPMKDDSFFWIASNSKAVIAVAVMICVDEGLLDLDVPVENYLPQLKDLKVAHKQENGSVLLTSAQTKPTLRQALSHTAGFPFITPFQEKYGIDSLPVQRLMTIVGTTPLIDEPGARYSYSNLGIDVGQAAVEAVTGKSFEEFLQERVFEPLEMSDTTFYPNEDQMKRLATPYAWDSQNERLKPIRFSQTPSLDDGSPRFAEGGGGLFSSAKDFIKFYQMLGGKGVGANGRRIVSEKAIEEISHKQTGDTLSSQYGFGVTVSDDSFGHGGAYGTQGIAYRDGSVVAVYMVAVAGLPKQSEADSVFRKYVESIAKQRAQK